MNKIITAALLTLGLTSSAHATYLTGAYITTDDPYTINLPVEQKANTRIDSAKLWMYFSDPSDFFWKQNEVLTVKFDNNIIGTISNVGATGQYYGLNVLPSYLSDGKLAVSLSLGCTRVSSWICTDQNVWLNDIFLAISRIPTMPTVPAIPVPPVAPVTPATPAVPTTPTAPASPVVTLPVPPTTVEPTAPTAPDTPVVTLPVPPTVVVVDPPAPVDPVVPVVTLPAPTTPLEPVFPGVPGDAAVIPGAPSDVPEPATLLTLALGLLGLGAARRRA